MTLRVKCRPCRGTGTVPLADHLAETLEVLETMGQATAPQMQARFVAVGVTALNNRLEKLYRLKLAQRRRNGRKWIYQIRKSHE